MNNKKLEKIPTYVYWLLIITCILFIIGVLMIVYLELIRSIAEDLYLSKWDWIALIVAVISLVVALMTWYSQNETRKNTAIVSGELLQNKLTAYYHYVIRNVVNLYSLHMKLELDKWESYPSEDYMWKMKLTEFDEDKISTEVVYKDEFHKIQNLNELIRFFNISVDAVVIHLKNNTLDKDTRVRDIINLKSMTWLIATFLEGTMDSLFPKDNHGRNKEKIREILTQSVHKWNRNVPSDFVSVNSGLFLPDVENKFINDVFIGHDESKKTFLKELNTLVRFHLGKRGDGYDRIPLIRF